MSGPSPRGRGKLCRLRGGIRSSRAIPAWAGKTPPAPPHPARSAGHPRVGGENREPSRNLVAHAGPSPRGRGKQTHQGSLLWGRRAIPAWAGKTLILQPVTAVKSINKAQSERNIVRIELGKGEGFGSGVPSFGDKRDSGEFDGIAPGAAAGTKALDAVALAVG